VGALKDELYVRNETIRKLHENPEHYLTEYLARFGNVLNADDAATLFDEYNRDPAKYRVAVHPAATWIRDELFQRALAVTAPEGRNRVVFTAGGNAAGKSTALAVTASAKEAQVVFDSTFANPEHARRLMDQALEAGKAVIVMHVSRPLEEIFPAMLDRAQLQGRVVTIEQLIGSHRGSAQTVRELSHDFEHNPGVDFLFIDNSGYGARQGTIELAAPQDYTEIRKRLYELLDREHQAGRISEENYHRISGGDRGEPPSQPSDGEGSGGGPSQAGSAESRPQDSEPSGISPAAQLARMAGMAENQPDAQPAVSFESSMDELEKVVKELEGGDLSLDRSLELFERGMNLSDICRKQLEEAETRVEMLIRKDGKTTAEPFRPEKQ